MTHIISLNMRGIGDPSKHLRLREMLWEKNLEIVLLQETLCNRDKAIRTFFSIFPGWNVAAIHEEGHAGG